MSHKNILIQERDPQRLARTILYISRILFPRYVPYYFPLFVLIELVKKYKNNSKKSLKRFRLYPMPNRLYDLLNKDEIIKSDHVIFTSQKIFDFYVHHKSLNWINLMLQIRGANSDSENKKITQDKPNGIVGKILNKQNVSMLVQAVPIKRCQLNSIFVKENIYQNFLCKYKLSEGDKVFVNLQGFQENHSLPQIATKATVVMVNTPYDLPSDIIDVILTSYFETPRFLYRNHTYEIYLDEQLLGTYYYSRHHHTFCNMRKIYFRCVNLESKNNNFEIHAIVAKNFTNLQQIASVNYVAPKQMLHDICFAELFPEGLRKYYNEIKSSVIPFLMQSNNVNKNILSCQNIFPTFLLQGDRGSGKNTLINALASNSGIHVYKVDSSEIVSTVSAQTEVKLKIVLGKSNICQPLIICLQNFEVFGVDNEGNEDLRLIATLQAEIMELFGKKHSYPVVLIALSNAKDIKPTIQRLFLEVIKITPPNKEERYDILRWLHTCETTCDQIFNNNVKGVSLYHTKVGYINRQTNEAITSVAEKTQGFLYGDLELLYTNSLKCQKYVKDEILLIKHFEKNLTGMQIAFSDSLGAPKVPKVLWSDIGGLVKLKDEIQSSIGLPLKHMHLMGRNLRRSGILLYGPPGTGKTLVAKAVATECNLSFLAVQGPELLNMYVGQSEQNVREVFARARAAAPCVVFLDELDSLAPNRGVAGDSGGVMDRVVSQLLAEMDGMTTGNIAQKQIFILAATNRPDLIDPALLRPGRFDKLLYVGPCVTNDDKIAVLEAQMKKFLLEKNLKFSKIAELLEMDMTGADLYSICSNAWLSAVRRTITNHKNGKLNENDLVPEKMVVNLSDFKAAVAKFVPSVSKQDLEYFNKLKMNFSC